jgi:hypothetical protein
MVSGQFGGNAATQAAMLCLLAQCGELLGSKSPTSTGLPSPVSVPYSPPHFRMLQLMPARARSYLVGVSSAPLPLPSPSVLRVLLGSASTVTLGVVDAGLSDPSPGLGHVFRVTLPSCSIPAKTAYIADALALATSAVIVRLVAT